MRQVILDKGFGMLECFLAVMLFGALMNAPAYSQTQAERGRRCTMIAGLAQADSTREREEMEKWADLCSGYEGDGGIICNSTKDLLLKKGEPYSSLGKRMRCANVAR